MRRYILILVAFLATITASAETRIDLGEMQLDTDYELSTFKNYIGTFTAPRSGVLTCTATTNDVMYPYHEALDDMNASGNEYSVTMNNLYGGRSYDFNVEEGKTYVMYARFIMNSNTVFRMTLSDAVSLEMTGISPADGETLNISNSGQVSVSFNKAVNCKGGTATVGDATQTLTTRVSTNSIFFETKEMVWNWLQKGIAKPGDVITFNLTGISLASDNTVLYNGDGNVSFSLVIGDMPITLVSTENTSTPFLSYYTDDNEAGIVKLTFSGRVSASRLSAVLHYGDIDKDSEGEYYVEYLTPTVSEDGMTVIVNLQGKRRRPVDMVASGTDYGTMSLGITGVLDENGNYAYSDGVGSLGSYWYAKTFQEITANVVAEFSPVSGSDITSKTKNFEIWITDEDKLSYNGIAFDYTKDNEQKHLLVARGDITKEADPDDSSASILTFAVPEELIGAKDIELSFENLKCADGTDYNNVLRAKYNTFVINRTSPIASSTLEWLTEGQQVKVYTNKDAALDNVKVVLRDLNPTEGDREVLIETTAEPLEGGKGFVFVCDRNYRLERAHDYQLEVTGLSDGEAVGEDYVIFHGAADPFRFSDVLFTSIEPGTDAVLTENSYNEITITFDGLVMLSADDNYILAAENMPLDAIEAIDPNEDGYANSWKLTVNGSTINEIGEELNLHIVATDLDERRVEGNTDYKDYSYLLFTYKTDSTSGIGRIENGKFKIQNYNVAGQRVSANHKGITIVNGKKKLIK